MEKALRDSHQNGSNIPVSSRSATCGSHKIIASKKIMEGLMKIFRVIAFVAMILTLTVTSLSVIGMSITGFYLGIIVFLLMSLISTASYFYAKQVVSKSNLFQRNYYRVFTVINLLSILVVLWMTFVILIDRVFPKL
jgi:hypothetical protein